MRCYQSEKNAERQIAHTHDTSKGKISNSLEPSQKTIFCLYLHKISCTYSDRKEPSTSFWRDAFSISLSSDSDNWRKLIAKRSYFLLIIIKKPPFFSSNCCSAHKKSFKNEKAASERLPSHFYCNKNPYFYCTPRKIYTFIKIWELFICPY